MLLLPDSHGFWSAAVPEKNKNFISGRDIIVNINQNDIRDIKESTLLSDRDSTARGLYNKRKGGTDGLITPLNSGLRVEEILQ
jgi:hypothetical protein